VVGAVLRAAVGAVLGEVVGEGTREAMCWGGGGESYGEARGGDEVGCLREKGRGWVIDMGQFDVHACAQGIFASKGPS